MPYFNHLCFHRLSTTSPSLICKKMLFTLQFFYWDFLAPQWYDFCEYFSSYHNSNVLVCNDNTKLKGALSWAFLLPWPKNRYRQRRNSWGWSTVRSCVIERYRASVWHWRETRPLRVASSRCRSKWISHDITWSHCGSISWISRL